jgi:hypothetical protein
MISTIQKSVNKQRQSLKKRLGNTMAEFAAGLPALLNDPDALSKHLLSAFLRLPYCKYVYVLDAEGVQMSSTVFRDGANKVDIGRDRSQRPYLKTLLQPGNENMDFYLSESYISKNLKRPSLTAIQSIKNDDGERIGFLGVDYDLRELPRAEEIYEEPRQHRQIKGDPAIREGLFLQQRAESQMDTQLDSVMTILEELMLEHGVYHCQIHYSSSRVTVWHVDDPYTYRILTMEELSDVGISLAYPRRPYFKRAIVPKQDIMKIFKQFSALRFADPTIYLRSGSLNLVNGFIGLNFSCDGTHYLIYDEFLQKGLDFWFGTSDTTDVRQKMLDDLMENLCQSGCRDVNKIISLLDQGEVPTELAELADDERDYIHKELQSIMQVYEGGSCEI